MISKKFRKLTSSNYDEKTKKLQNTSLNSSRRKSNILNMPLTSQLNNLIEENDEESSQEVDIKNISFELSKVDEMNDLLDNFSNKSDEKVDIVYESTTNEQSIELIEDFLKQKTIKIIEEKKGFDPDIKNMSENFYNDLVNNISSDIKNKKIEKKFYDKSPLSKRQSLKSEGNNFKFKNDLIIQNDTIQSYGKFSSFMSKNKSYNFNEEINEDD